MCVNEIERAFSMNNVSFNPNLTAVNFKADVEKTNNVKNTELLKEEAPQDSFEFEHKTKGTPLSKEDKQEILKKAKTTAAGWSVFGEGFSTLYYGLRSNKTIAKKYNLDEKQDKAFIKQIKREQVISTLPGVIFPSGGGVINWLYNKVRDESKLDVK